MPQYATNSSEAIKVLVPARLMRLSTSVIVIASVPAFVRVSEVAVMELGVPMLTKVQAPVVVSAVSNSWREALQ
jgi:hypothetical protein